ncbi:trypsin-like serine peptidase [Halorubrum ezzemoulense]|uniref:trypsin-like serine peptidase n=1 Tax=Halorubrum ezzemoulense TaxID=337243 RepID=UPI001642BF24|nr:trypsin-like peptidase domain-containing protein [Halorubrum ezzemoulense]
MNQRRIATIGLCVLLIISLIPVSSVATQNQQQPKNAAYSEAAKSIHKSSADSSTSVPIQSNASNSSQKAIPAYVPNSRAHKNQAELTNSTKVSITDTQHVTTNKKIATNDTIENLTVVYNGSAQWTEGPIAANQATSVRKTSTEGVDQYSQSPTPPTNAALEPNINNGIIGDDSRLSVRSAYDITNYPWSSIVTLQLVFPDGTRSQCSGAIINGSSSQPPGHVLTAGHCVYSAERGGWVNTTTADSSYVVPGADGTQEPFGRVGIQKIRSYPEWITNENPAYDIALITLDERIGDETGALGYIGIDNTADEVYTHTPTRVTGYPSDKQAGTMWTSVGEGQGTYNFAASEATPEDIVHRYTVDTQVGMSGGPVWVEEYPTPAERQIVSIHAYAVDSDLDGNTEYTQGTRLTESRFSNIQSWTASDSIPDAANDQFEPNDDFISATEVTNDVALDNLRIVSDDVDMFATDLLSGQQLTATSTFDHTQGDLDMVLYNPDQELVAKSQSTTDGEQIEHTSIRNGTYYMAVYGHDDASASYSLSFSTSGSTDSSNDSLPVPAEWTLSTEQYFTLYEDGKRPGTQTISSKLNEWHSTENNSINDVEYSTQEISTALNYWFRSASGGKPIVPTDWELSEKQYFVFYEDGERPSTQEVSAKINQWLSSDSNSVNAVGFNPQEISNAINYWFSNM